MAKITCQICGAQTHSIQLHLKNDHADEGMSVEQYQAMYPDAPLFSPEALKAIEEKRSAETARTHMAGTATAEKVVHMKPEEKGTKKVVFHEHFKLGRAKAARNARGEPIEITVMTETEHEELVPDVDPNYVFDIDLLKILLMGVEKKGAVYLWGHAGTGKSTVVEQMCAYTNRAMMRVQHTANMEERDVTGTWTVKGGETVFELGPLALAMKHGWIYLADEYDFAHPSVTSVYQAVLEGKSLVIKEADEANRIIKPHPNFRFIATGNTNGSGDEHGLYQGTNLQNAANYSRFKITYQVNYMEPKAETLLVSQQASVLKEDAGQVVGWANEIRKAYENRKIGATVGPRELIHAAEIGAARGSFRSGIQLSITNRWSSVDREIGEEIAQRMIGEE